jgi:hypothetical protein
MYLSASDDAGSYCSGFLSCRDPAAILSILCMGALTGSKEKDGPLMYRLGFPMNACNYPRTIQGGPSVAHADARLGVQRLP